MITPYLPSSCRELQTVEALGWTALGLAAFTFIVSLIAIHATRRKHGYRGTYYDYDYSYVSLGC